MFESGDDAKGGIGGGARDDTLPHPAGGAMNG